MKKIYAVCLLFLAIIMLAAIGNAIKHTPEPNIMDVKIEPVQVNLSAQILTVKPIDGKYRYFFSVKNKSQATFSGSLKINVYDGESGAQSVWDEEFKDVTIDPDTRKTIYLDTYSGPKSVHGQYGIQRYDLSIKDDGKWIRKDYGDINL